MTGHEVVFIDTSVLVNLLDVPHRNSDRRQLATEFARLQGAALFVLPVTAIIETGNHIAQIADGGKRRICAQGLMRFLQLASAAQPPWVLSGVEWGPPLIEAMIHGDAGRPSALELLNQQIGLGDVSILAEREAFRARVPSGTPIRIWTLDAGLRAYS